MKTSTTLKLISLFIIISLSSCNNQDSINPQKDLPSSATALQSITEDESAATALRLEAYLKLGNINKQTDATKAEASYKDLLTLATEENNTYYQARAYHSLGLINRANGNMPKALNFYLKAIDINEKIGETARVGDDYNNIGYIFYSMNSYEEAIEYFNKAVNVYSAINDDKYAANTYKNLALSFTLKNTPNYKEAHLLYNKALELLNQSSNNNHAINEIYNAIGWLNIKEGDFKKAIKNYELSLDKAELTGDKSLISRSEYNIAEAYMFLEDYKSTIFWLEKADLSAREGNLSERSSLQSLNIKGELQARLNNHTEAIAIYKKAIAAANTEVINEPLNKTLDLITNSQKALVDAGHKVNYQDFFMVNDLKEQQQELKKKFEESIDSDNLKVALAKEIESHHFEVKQAKITNEKYMILKSVGLIIITLISALATIYFISWKRKKELARINDTIQMALHVLKSE